MQLLIATLEDVSRVMFNRQTGSYPDNLLFKVILFMDSTMVNHHFCPAFGEYFCNVFFFHLAFANPSNDN